jgi:hypothetical protein
MALFLVNGGNYIALSLVVV